MIGAISLALGGLFHLARKLLDPLAHDFPRFELHCCPGRDDETAARLVGIAADTRFRKARLEDAEIAQFNGYVACQAVGDLVQSFLNDLKDLVLHHSGLIADRHDDVAFGELAHGISDSSVDHRMIG